ncbi:MAG: AAA family ATPase, partial [Polyangiales bacterium]
YYVVQRGEVTSSSIERPPPAAADRLYLVTASGMKEFRPLYDALSSMSVYNISPGQIREVQPPDPGHLLARDGRNIASVLGRLESELPDGVQQIKEYLSRIVPGLKDVERSAVASKETLLFRQDVKGASHPWKSYANSMSDGTLRALGVLVALTQGADPKHPVPVVGVEEPEAALHPAGAAVLFEALRAAAESTQVMVTSHSPDLLDSEDVSESELLAVTAESGVTIIGPISEVGRSALRDHLYTAGELLRMAQLEPDETAYGSAEQLDLFEPLRP